MEELLKDPKFIFQVKQSIFHALCECYAVDADGIIALSAISGCKRRNIEVIGLDMDVIAIEAYTHVQNGDYLYYREHQDLFDTADTIKKLFAILEHLIPKEI